MKITVFGMGYVGCVTAACLADHGHDVTGVDVDEVKVSLINAGHSPIIEPGLEELIQRGLAGGRLRAATKAASLGDVALVSVGTPSSDNGNLSLGQMRKVVGEIGLLLRATTDYVVINVRSTVLAGTVEEVVIPLLEEQSGKRCGPDFGVCMNPEFLRETTAVRDFADPPFTVIGARDARAADRVQEIYARLSAPVERTSLKEAEMIKYACNAFHAAKVCFANEIGNLSKQLGVDSHRVMEIFCRDKQLNLSPYYLKPGFAFGGSCLPKDLRAILYKAKQLDVELPMLASLLESNRRQVEKAITLIRQTGKNRIGLLGLSFKAGTDDLRESPMVVLIETLIGKGHKIAIYDAEVSLAALRGANKKYIEQVIPHIASLLAGSIREVIDSSDVIVVGKKSPEFQEAVTGLNSDKTVIDLVRVVTARSGESSRYEGIAW